MDRYLSVILGHPRIFRDEDVDQQLPDRVIDADLATGAVKSNSVYNQCVSDGPVFHAKFVRLFFLVIISCHCSYSINRLRE